MTVLWFRRLVTSLSSRRPRLVLVVFVVDRVAWERVFSDFFDFLLSISLHRGSPYAYTMLFFLKKKKKGSGTCRVSQNSVGNGGYTDLKNMFSESRSGLRSSDNFRNGVLPRSVTKIPMLMYCGMNIWPVGGRSSET
jgi:hypothetical protein